MSMRFGFMTEKARKRLRYNFLKLYYQILYLKITLFLYKMSFTPDIESIREKRINKYK